MSFDLCTLLRFVILMAAGFACIALILWLCPGFSYGTIPPQYSWIPGVAFAGFVGIAFVAALIWEVVCRPSWCSFLALCWELLFIIGAILTYAGFCPGCPWFLIGIAVFALSVILFSFWTWRCRPTICTVFSELLFVTIAFDITNLIEIVLGFCVLTSRPQAALGWALAVAAFNVFVLAGLNQNRCLRRG
jgi:hypothetical protein